MTFPPAALAAWAGAYLLGSVPVGFLLVKMKTGTDVRTAGSGNIGATNVTRVAGKGLGRLVFALDLAKGLAAVLVIAPALLAPTLEARLSCGLAAVVGHCFPVFLKFRGGKGVATAIGAIAGTMPPVAACMLTAWVLVFFASRIVSAASLAAALTVPAAQAGLGLGGPALPWGLALAALIIARHHQNIGRLLRGEEHRFGNTASK